MLRVAAYITAYKRPEMLNRVVSHLESFGVSCRVYEDGVTHQFRGKREFWRTWDDMLKDAKKTEAGLYLFTQDDFLDIDVKRILTVAGTLAASLYAYNLIYDGRVCKWTGIRAKKISSTCILSGFIDCNFFTNRLTLKKLGFHMNPVPDTWFVSHQSSGVGCQLSNRCKKAKIPCYSPTDSFGYHGDHPSVMHFEERRKNPLISIHHDKKP